MINITDKTQCCGCEACMQICPKHCISYSQDAEGFSYPFVNMDLCIHCGLCDKICTVLNQNQQCEPKKVFAAINQDYDIRYESSSGGVFSLLANYVIEKGGVVFGVCFDAQWRAVIDIAETKEDARKFRGSKYVQASIGNSYSYCEKYLLDGRMVLFSGTPCQISGLLHYLRKPFSNLLTVDIICYGVPSPLIWQRYLNEIVELTNPKVLRSQIKRIQKSLTYNLNYENIGQGKVGLVSPANRNYYMRAFLSGLSIRPSCSDCPAKGGASHSDITLGDCWGIQDIQPSMDDNKGISAVMIHTEKGEKLFESLHVMKRRIDYNEIKQHNKAVFKSAVLHSERDTFFKKIIVSENVNDCLKEYTQLSLRERITKMKSIMSKLKIDKYNISTEPHLTSISFRNKKDGWRQYALYWLFLTEKN